MSRCFPFPPPGYENKARPDDSNLIIKEKHKHKKHKDKKDKDKKERSERKDKEKTEGKHDEEKDCKEKKQHRDKKDEKKDKRKSSEDKNEIVGPSGIQNDEKPDPYDEWGDGASDCRILVEMGKRVGNGGMGPYKDGKKEKWESSEQKKIARPSGKQDHEKPGPSNEPGDVAHGCKMSVEMGKRVRNDDEVACKKDKKKHKSSEAKKILVPSGNQNGEKLGRDNEPGEGACNYKMLSEMGNRVRNDNAAKDNSHAIMANGQSIRTEAKCSGNNWVGNFSGEKRIKVENSLRQANMVEKRKESKDRYGDELENENRDKNEKEDKKRKKEEKKEKAREGSKEKIIQRASNGNFLDFCASNKPEGLIKETWDRQGKLSEVKEPILNGFLHDDSCGSRFLPRNAEVLENYGNRPDNMSRPAIHQASQNGSGSHHPSQKNIVPLAMEKQDVIARQTVSSTLPSPHSVSKKPNLEPGHTANNSASEHLRARINSHAVSNGSLSSQALVENIRKKARPNNTDGPDNMSRPAIYQASQNGSGSHHPCQKNTVPLAMEKQDVIVKQTVSSTLPSAQSVSKNVPNLEPGHIANNSASEHLRARINSHAVSNGSLSSQALVENIRKKARPNNTDGPDNMSRPAIYQASQNGSGSHHPSQKNTVPLAMEKQDVIVKQTVSSTLPSAQSVSKNVPNLEPGHIANNSASEHLRTRINSHAVSNGSLSSQALVENRRKTARPNNTDGPDNMSRPAIHQAIQNGSGSHHPSQKNTVPLAMEKQDVIAKQTVSSTLPSPQSLPKNVPNLEPGHTANNSASEHLRTRINSHAVSNGSLSSQALVENRRKTARPNNTDGPDNMSRPAIHQAIQNGSGSHHPSQKNTVPLALEKQDVIAKQTVSSTLPSPLSVSKNVSNLEPDHTAKNYASEHLRTHINSHAVSNGSLSSQALVENRRKTARPNNIDGPDNMSRPVIHQVSQNGSGCHHPSQKNTVHLAMEKQDVIAKQTVSSTLPSPHSVSNNVPNLKPVHTANNSASEHLRTHIISHAVSNGSLSSQALVENRSKTARPNNTDGTVDGPRLVFVHENDGKDFGVNGILECRKNISPPPSASVKPPKEKVGFSMKKAPHPDLKYLSQILTVPKLDLPRFDNDDDQDWTFCCKDAKKPESGHSETECTKRVWANAVRLESADVTAFPYVIPY
ncbi:hypothetical protein OROGR_022225 [Orobanche gracilis]